MRRAVILTFLLTVGGAARGLADDCDYERPVRAELEAAGATGLDIDAAAGFLVVEGERGLDRVMVEGRACASRESRLDDIELRTGRRGERLFAEVDIPEIDFSFGGYAQLDLTLRVPAGLALRIEDGSGEVRIRDVASVELDDGSGEIAIGDVDGDVRIVDGSGEIEVRDVAGRVTVADGSGGIDIRTAGDVHIEEDGSGEIEISQIRGDVEVDSDGSGGMTFSDVTGRVRVGSDGSGSIWVSQVGGGFELGSDGSGSVHLDDVGGIVELP